MQLFYKANFGSEHYLDEVDSKHCIRVLRKKVGDIIQVTDGRGNFFSCSIEEDHPKKTKLTVLEIQTEFEKPERNIHLVIAPTKNLDRMEYLVEKAVEIGVSQISFICTQNSERRTLKLDRLNRIAISAMKQSLKAYLPNLNELVPISDFLNSCEDATCQNFLAHLSEDSERLVKKILGNEVCILIGPEGDFSKDEIILAQAKGFQLVSMGHSRLRTETAGIVAVSLLNIL